MLPLLAAASLAASCLAAASCLSRRIHPERPAGATTTAARLAPLFIFLSPRQVRLAWGAAGLVAAVVLAGLGVPAPAAVLGGLLAPCSAPLLIRHLERRRRRRLAAQLPDALLALASGLRAGRALPQALAMVAGRLSAPLGQELTLAVRESGVGRPLEAGLEGLLARHPTEDVRLAVTAIALGSRLGGDLADLLERIAESIRERQRLEARMAVLTSQGRAQGALLALLPAALAAVIHTLDPAYLAPLVTTGIGRMILTGTIVLQLLGLLAVRRIVASEP